MRRLAAAGLIAGALAAPACAEDTGAPLAIVPAAAQMPVATVRVVQPAPPRDTSLGGALSRLFLRKTSLPAEAPPPAAARPAPAPAPLPAPVVNGPIDLTPAGGRVEAPPVAPPPAKAAAVGVPMPRLRPGRSDAVAALPPASPATPIVAAAAIAPPPPPTGPAEALAGDLGDAPIPMPPVVASPAPPPAPERPAAAVPPRAIRIVGPPVLDDSAFYVGSITPAPASPAPPDQTAAPLALDLSLDGEPYQLVRTLQLLQDQMAAGSTAALAAQRQYQDGVNQHFLAAPPTTWANRLNAEAAVTFVLSGGAPDILRQLASLDPPPAVDKNLVTGVLAYVEGREADAKKALAGIDALGLPPSMGGQVALAQAALAVRTDPVKAMALLDAARLMAPGTLVEEAALRREIFVADQLHQQEKLQALARAYLDRFRHSVYAGNFRNRLLAAVSHMDFSGGAEGLARLDRMLALAEPDSRRELYLTVALASVISGRTGPAVYAADEAVKLAVDGTPDALRAHLYRAAARVVDAKAYDDAVADLKLVDRARLSESDSAIYDAVATRVGMLDQATVIPDAPPFVMVADAGNKPPADTPAIVQRAQTAILAADDILKKASQ